jgi:hypothetical protein
VDAGLAVDAWLAVDTDLAVDAGLAGVVSEPCSSLILMTIPMEITIMPRICFHVMVSWKISVAHTKIRI